MKRLLFILLIIAGLFEGCKYEDGPLFSLLSAKNRIYGNHILTKYTVNGIDSLDQMHDRFGLNFYFYHVDVNDDDAIKIDGPTNGYISTYLLINNNRTMRIKLGSIMFTNYYAPDEQDIDWQILKLKANDIKMKTDYNGKEYIIELE